MLVIIMVDEHVKMYGKEFHEVEFLEIKCPMCKGRVDEFGYCNCGTGDS